MNKLKILGFFFVFAFTAHHVLATHNRAGEITYRHLSGFTYEITITTCTKSSAIADRPWLKIRWGDEPVGTVNAQLDSLERISIDEFPDIDSQINTYTGVHSYGGPGVFTISVEDPNRNSGVQNIPNSVQQTFCIQSVLVINPQAGHNNSVVLLNPPKERACLFKYWIHNPGAYDPDGDDLVYSLVECLGSGCLPIDEYQLPDANTVNPNDIFSIDSETGDVVWDVPPTPGEFNVAILIEEYREGIFVGSVLRDMQITVEICDNNPPVISPINDICVEAGGSVGFVVQASDPDNDDIDLSAFGGPFTEVLNQAVFNPVTGLFSWNPECEEVRAQPYSVTFEATDDNFQVELTDLETVLITVVAPAVENPAADADGNSIMLTWDSNPCVASFNEAEAVAVVYKIYRRQDLFGFIPDLCELGVPDYTGYSYIGEVQGVNTTTYTDNELYYGGNYCYMVVTCWPDGALSYASEEFCAEIIKDSPIITKVSIGLTDIATGRDTISWSPPSEVDTENFLPPYRYKLYWSEGNAQPSNLIYTSNEFNGTDFQLWADTVFIHENINTATIAHNYHVEFYSSGDLIGVSSDATSVFLNATEGDNEITLTANQNVPWSNYNYFVYRFDNILSDFVLIGETATGSYTDSGINNNEENCYKFVSLGTYSADDYLDSLYNHSMEICAVPYDMTPPCAPQITIDPDCDLQTDLLMWNNPNLTCADDVTGYNLYYSPIEGGEMELYASFDLASDTLYIFNELGDMNSIAGCFAVTAVDSLNLWPDGLLHQNESEMSNVVCADNCPFYFLPNIFTPNGDLLNDLLVPFPYRFIESIDLNIYNRWGGLVFHTTDPEINWNGFSQSSGELSSDGTYYYVINVNTIRLSGIVTESFSGNIQLQNGKKPANVD